MATTHSLWRPIHTNTDCAHKDKERKEGKLEPVWAPRLDESTSNTGSLRISTRSKQKEKKREILQNQTRERPQSSEPPGRTTVTTFHFTHKRTQGKINISHPLDGGHSTFSNFSPESHNKNTRHENTRLGLGSVKVVYPPQKNPPPVPPHSQK